MSAHSNASGADGQRDGPRLYDVVQWKSGEELPPFTSGNTHVLSLLRGLCSGTVEPQSALRVSRAVAVQIWLLIFDSGSGSFVLRDVGWTGFYTIVGSLALGSRPAVDQADVDRLRMLMGRKATKDRRASRVRLVLE